MPIVLIGVLRITCVFLLSSDCTLVTTHMATCREQHVCKDTVTGIHWAGETSDELSPGNQTDLQASTY